jgi:mannose-1-phosphate guanylyltransferase
LKALLIAGGFGTRLRPLTHTRPKHLLPIANKPHIEHVFDLLQAHGVDDVVLLTSYLADAFAETVDRARDRGLRVEIAHETEPLGTAGAIKNAEHLIGQGTFFAFNGDVLSTVDLTAALEFHRANKATGTIVLTPVDDPSAYGVVSLAADGRVESFVEKPSPGEVDSNLINAGVYVLEPEVLAAIPAEHVVSIEREVFPILAERGSLFGMATDAYWMDIGTPEKYLQANMDALAGGGNAIADSARIDATAQVSSSCLGEGCSIEANAVVERSVLLDEVVVGEGARVTDSTLGEGVRVAPGAIVTGATAGDGDVIGQEVMDNEVVEQEEL